MNSLLLARMEDLEDLKKTVRRLPRCDFPNLQRMAPTGLPLIARINWCGQQRRQSRSQAQLEGWRAEEEGLRDALFKRDGTYQHRDSPPSVFERYVMGLEDGRALIRLGSVDCIWHPAPDETHP